MIEWREESLPIEAENKLRQWLIRAEYDTLIRILESRARQAMAEAANVQLDLDKHPNYLAKSDECMDRARRYRTCMEVLEQLRAQQTVFTTVKLS